MSVPGISAYPDLEQKLRYKLQEARSARGCSRCHVARVVAQFRQLVQERQKRDKSP